MLNTILKSSCRLRSSLPALLVVIYAAPLQAQPASLHGDLLTLPVVVVDDLFYNARFQLDLQSEPIRLDLIDAYEVRPANTTGASAYHHGELLVSDLFVDSSSFWVKFQLLNDTRFTLLDYGINDDGTSRNPVGITEQPAWQRMPGEAIDVGVGADGSVWVVGTDERAGGFGIYYWDGNTWLRVEGGAVRIDVDPSGNPWIVNDRHELYRYRDGIWQHLPGEARDVGIGANGAVWVVSGGGVYRWNGIGWDRTSGSATRIDVGPSGQPWVVDSTNDIYRLDDGRWTRLPGAARDIGVGSDGSAWLIGTSSDSGGHGIYRWLDSQWNQVDGSGRHVSVEPDGKPWVVSSDGEIYRAQ